VRGKFLYVGDQKLYVSGVTYGPFRPDQQGCQYHGPDVVVRDFKRMAAHGINAIRTYTVPPRWLLDVAEEHGLWVMVGLPWEQHVAFLDDQARPRSIEERVGAGVRSCAGHPAVLCYAIGSEIPASIVRWHGRRRVEAFLRRLFRAAKAQDPKALVTYVNYPTTEYLQLPFLDFQCFDVYLESQDRLEAYLARLQNLSAEKPLVIGELGLDCARHGEHVQGHALDWQIRSTFAAGCAGLFVFAWTDEWHRGGTDVRDWRFGVTRRDRSPRPALETVRAAFGEVPYSADLSWPFISVVICTHNGSRTIRECFEGVKGLQYPNYEVIVVSDGSTDATEAIAREFGLRLISTENRGLSSARNTGMRAARGDIVAYIDDDAWPDPHWLTYLAAAFLNSDHAGIGGLNIAPPGDGFIADCVANAPGGPIHVLLTDQEAEHVPGCNMAFWKANLASVRGFDPQFRVAGDDVDLCWRLQQRGWTLGFSAAALVWHHRRNSIRAYWNQQWHYGRAEAMLERKWPEKYNRLGHLNWRGRLYGNGLRVWPFRRWLVYHGIWGSGLFQSLYGTAPGRVTSLLLMPEWYLVIAALASLALLGLVWRPLLVCLPLLALALGALLVQAVASAAQASFRCQPQSTMDRLKAYGLTAILHLIQPVARLGGRLRHGLTPWRRRGGSLFAFPRPRVSSIWSERWRAPDRWLGALESILRGHGVVVEPGGAYDAWDLAVRGGLFGTVLLCAASEDHEDGRQLLRIRSWPRVAPMTWWSVLVLTLLASGAALHKAWLVATILGAVPLALTAWALADCAVASASYLSALQQLRVTRERYAQPSGAGPLTRSRAKNAVSWAKHAGVGSRQDAYRLHQSAAPFTVKKDGER
jgi:glycosyltransferase involved in cell wall biosynthesis